MGVELRPTGEQAQCAEDGVAQRCETGVELRPTGEARGLETQSLHVREMHGNAQAQWHAGTSCGTLTLSWGAAAVSRCMRMQPGQANGGWCSVARVRRLRRWPACLSLGVLLGAVLLGCYATPGAQAPSGSASEDNASGASDTARHRSPPPTSFRDESTNEASTVQPAGHAARDERPQQRVAASDVSEREREWVDREQFRRLTRVAPATVLDGRDFRSPSFVARRFLRAVLRNDADGWRQSVHLEAPLVLGPLLFEAPATEDGDERTGAAGERVPYVEPASFSVWRTRLGRFDGIAGWAVTDWDVPEVGVFLAPSQPNSEITLLRLRPDPRPPEPTAELSGEAHEARSWRVYWVERTFEPESVVAGPQWVARRFDERESQSRYRGDEALQQPQVSERQLTRWLTGIVSDARAERLDGVRARTLSDEERRTTDPPAWHLLKDAPSLSQQALKRRLARIVQAPRALEGVLLLDQYQVAGSGTVYVRSLAVFGDAHQMRQAYRLDWRLAQGLYKIAHIEPVPLTPRLESLFDLD